MNKPIPSKITYRLAWGVISALIASASLVGSSGLMAQSQDKQKKEAQADWPETAPYNTAIHAFDAALTRAGWDLSFRQRLIKSPESARAAVAEEGHIRIPANKVILFYEAQPPKPDTTKSASITDNAYRAIALQSESKSNENVHVFYLPPFKENDRTKHYKYEDYFMCCYDEWRRQ
jgi:hypothetical protein